MNKLLAVIIVVFVGLVAYLSLRLDKLSKTTPPSVETNEVVFPTPVPPHNLDSEKLWSLIQDWRKSDDCRVGGCQEYVKDERLCTIAEDRVDDDDNNHEGFIKKIKSDYYKLGKGIAVSENATGGESEEDMLRRWLNSSDHVEALRKSYRYSCVAVSGDNLYNFYAVQIFSNFQK